MDMELADLEAFVAVSDLLHFTRAADRLHVTQPALSKRIRRLEDTVGGPLLVRQYRDVRLTPTGRALAARARLILQASREALAFSQRAARGEAGLLRIGFGIASLLGLLPDVLLRFRRAYPDVQLQLRDMSTPDQIAALGRDDLDVGFVRLPVHDARLVVRPALDERLVAALGPRSPWDVRLGLRSLEREPFLLVSRVVSASFRDHVLDVCAASGFAPHVVQEASEIFTVLSLVRAGLGVSLVPRSASAMRLPGVRFRELALPEAAWDIGLAWRKDAGAEALVNRFVGMVPQMTSRTARHRARAARGSRG
jgi:DNA-binding transcriptional LysR family regulator